MCAFPVRGSAHFCLGDRAITVYYRLNIMRIRDNRFVQAAIIILAVLASALAGAGVALWVRW